VIQNDPAGFLILAAGTLIHLSKVGDEIDVGLRFR
jgi:hypothetical protein